MKTNSAQNRRSEKKKSNRSVVSSSGFLKERFLGLSKNNPRYSLRAFAKKLNITPSGLSQILSGKCKLSLDRAADFAQKLSLSEEEKSYFFLLVQMDQAKSIELKSQLNDQLKQHHPKIAATHNLTIDQFRMISEWYGLALLKVISTYGAQWSDHQLAKHLRISLVEVSSMLDRLVRLELVQKTNHGWERIADRIHLSADLPSDAVRKFYKNCLPLITESIDAQAPSEKTIGAEYLVFSKNQVSLVHQVTEDYFNKLIELSQKSKNPTEIYQAFVNVYRINQKMEKEK